MGSGWLGVGAIGCALAVAAGAFGAHGLQSRLDARGLALWETAARYLMYGAIGIVLVGLAWAQRQTSAGGAVTHGAAAWLPRAAWALALGTAVFSGTVGALALGAPRWLGAITPIGGLLMIVGYLLFAWAALAG